MRPETRYRPVRPPSGGPCAVAAAGWGEPSPASRLTGKAAFQAAFRYYRAFTSQTARETSTSQNPACVGRGNGVYSFPVKLTARQIERLVKQGEVVHTECKDASGGLPNSLWESYSSFANTDGGVIVLGVKEVGRKFSIAGVQKAATLIKRFWDGVNNREKVSVNILFDRHVYSVNKAVAVEGGTSDARNSHIFNIFALVDIGERSGTGLADLYGHWKKYNFPDPTIAEEYDPDRVKITVYTDSDQGLTNRPKVPQGTPKVPQEAIGSAPKTAQGAPKVPQTGPRSAQDRPKLDPESAQGAPRVPQGCPKR